MGKLSFCVGPSHSGKSTFCNKWIKETDPDGYHRVIVNTDKIRLALHGKRFNSHAEPQVFAAKYLMIKTLYLSGYHVLNDGTNTTDISIRRLLEIDQNATPIIFNTPLKTCIERIKLTNQLDMEPVIIKHYNQLQKLLEEGIENVRTRLLKDVETRWKIV